MRKEIRNIRDVGYVGYERLLGEARARRTIRMLDAGDERRRHPRFPVHTDVIASPAEGVLAVADMSITGLAFRSDRLYIPEHPLTLSLANVFSAVVDIVACDRISDPALTPPRYRVRCRFCDEEHGLQFLTLTLEVERIERS